MIFISLFVILTAAMAAGMAVIVNKGLSGISLGFLISSIAAVLLCSLISLRDSSPFIMMLSVAWLLQIFVIYQLFNDLFEDNGGAK